jgi:hypothetical protein
MHQPIMCLALTRFDTVLSVPRHCSLCMGWNVSFHIWFVSFVLILTNRSVTQGEEIFAWYDLPPGVERITLGSITE